MATKDFPRSVNSAIVIFCMTAAISCGKTDQARSWNGEDPNFDLNQPGKNIGLMGKWHGGLKDKRDESPTKLMPMTLVIAKDKSFQLEIDSEGNQAKASGTYIQFQESILFTIERSTLSLFGLAGSQRDLHFSLYGNALTLFDDQIECKLQSGDSPDSNSSNPIADDSSRLIGKWQGKDKKKNDWYLSLTPDFFFSARVENSVSNPLHIEGSFAIDPEAVPEKAELVTTKTNNPATAAMKIFIVYSPTTKKLEVHILGDEGSEVQSFLMDRI